MLEDRQVPTVLYYGGNLLPHVEAQALFLGKDWSSNSTFTAQTATLNSFLTDVTGGAYMDALTGAGYGVGRGTATTGVFDNTTFTSGSVISDATIRAAIKADLTANANAPTPLQALDANRFYVVYVDPNVAVNLGGGQGTTQQGILGYHGAFAGPLGATVRYAVVVSPTGPAHNSSLGVGAVDQMTDVSSHELAEGVTDPDVNYAQLGWYDPRRGEIGDVTENLPNAEVRLDSYLVQLVANKNDQLLTLTATPPPPSNPGNPVATTSTLTAGQVQYHWFSPPTVTLTVTLGTASGSTLPSGTVDLIYNGSVLGAAQVQVVNGVAEAVFTVEFYGSGSFTFSAQYLGSSAFQGSTSNSVTVHV